MRDVLFICLLFFVGPSLGLFSKWLRNTDLNNPSNWDRGNLPCGNDRMILPDDGPVVFMQLNATIQELVLPRDGEVVFGQYVTLAFTNDPDHSAACLDSGSDITFNASHPADWMDPDNWCPSDSERGSCKPLSLLDSERIPCKTDDVVFPTGSSYYVNQGANLNIEINTLKVSGKAYSTLSFRDFLATENGRDIFPAPSTGSRSTINILRRRCNDPTGCGCGNDQGQILQAVCQLQSTRCRRPLCRGYIRPVGHCCNICGGMMNVSYGVGFSLDTLKTGLQRNFLDGKESYKDVKYIVSKRSDGKIQIVLQDDDGQRSSKVAMEIFADLKKDAQNGGMKYGITEVKVQTTTGGGASQFGGKTSAHTGSKQSMGGGSVAGITMGVIIAVVIVFGGGYLIYRDRNRQMDDDSSFTANVFNKFNRFNLSQKRNAQVSVPPSIDYGWGHDGGVSCVSAGTSQGFDNPIYGSVPMENMKPIELEPTDFGMMTDIQPVDRGFDNPLYDTDHQESLFSDPSMVDNPELPTVMTLGPSNQDTEA